jgi:hypothetical protein
VHLHDLGEESGSPLEENAGSMEKPWYSVGYCGGDFIFGTAADFPKEQGRRHMIYRKGKYEEKD